MKRCPDGWRAIQPHLTTTWEGDSKVSFSKREPWKCHAKRRKPDTKDHTFMWFHTGESWNEGICSSRKETSDWQEMGPGKGTRKHHGNHVASDWKPLLNQLWRWLWNAGYTTPQILYFVSVNCLIALTNVSDTFISFKSNNLIQILGESPESTLSNRVPAQRRP